MGLVRLEGVPLLLMLCAFASACATARRGDDDATDGDADSDADADSDGDSDVDADADADGDSDVCDEQDFEIAMEPVRVQIVLDQSSSMAEAGVFGVTCAGSGSSILARACSLRGP
jgi:hypothetical protein